VAGMNEYTVVVQLICKVRETPLFAEEEFFLASTEPLGLSARFLIDLTIDVAGSDEKSTERHSK